MDDKISPEYFHLIRKVLREKEPHTERPLKKKRRTRGANASEKDDTVANCEIISADSPIKHDVISLSSSGSDFEEATPESTFEEDSPNDDDDSDEFEDVTEPSEVPEKVSGDISIIMDVSGTTRKQVTERKPRNVCSNEERKYRKYMHMAVLLCLMIHGALRNSWIGNAKLLRRLSKLVPDKVFRLLHPEKDEELPLRSTRKLLDGLKMCMEIWQKHWKIMRRYEGYECYMKHWDEIKGKIDMKRSLTEQQFVRQVLKGQGNRDIASQGFIALLRSCSLNARLVMSCQPPDFTDLKEHLSVSKKKRISESTFKYPIFWCEVWDKFSKKWITIDPINLKTIEQIRFNSKLEPHGVAGSDRNCMRYVIAYDRKDGCKDITRRYQHWFNSKCRRRRITKEPEGAFWYEKILKKLHRRKKTKIDDYEDEYMRDRDENESMPDNIQDLKNHPKFVLEKDLKANQCIKAGCKECGYLNVNHKKKILKVYNRRDVLDLKSARQWYNDGRILKIGSKYRKIIQKQNWRKPGSSEETREERLYSIEDTEVYIAPLASAPDGKIVKNTFGNIEVLTPTMIPMNCCLVESPVAIKAANFLQIEYARAVTGFKFEKGNSAKPIIGGVVVAQWFKEAILAAIDGIEYCAEREEFEKHDLESLNRWYVLLMKLRIKNNLNESYGKVNETTLVDAMQEKTSEDDDDTPDDHVTDKGGFFPHPTNNVDAGGQASNLQPKEEPLSTDNKSAEQISDREHYDDDYNEFMEELDL